jgi:MYXO-CTERM domain-containing protein
MSPSGRAALAGVVLGVVMLASVGRAQAYVRYRTEETMVNFYWPQTWVPVSVYPDSMQVNGKMEMTPEQILAASTAAADVWSDVQNPCTYLRINVASSSAATPVARYDGRNALVFRTTSWCAPTDKPGMCSYDAAALAITSVFVNKKDGRIRDADIEVNSLNFIWTDLDTEPDPVGKQDLQNALAHEMGHLIGLDHTCVTADSGEVKIDNLGQPAPVCETAPQAVKETTMFASATPGDVGKRTLAPDDKLAVCEIYPLADDPKVYKTYPDEETGCACAVDGAGGAGRGAGVLVALVGVVASLALRRRGRSGG